MQNQYKHRFPQERNALQSFTCECLWQDFCDLELFVKDQWLFRVSHQNWFSVSKEGSACNVRNSWGKGNNYMSAPFSSQKEHFSRLTHDWGGKGHIQNFVFIFDYFWRYWACDKPVIVNKNDKTWHWWP